MFPPRLACRSHWNGWREDRHEGRHVESKGQLAGCAEGVLGHGLGCPGMGRLITGTVFP